MNTTHKASGLAIAVVAASLFAMAPVANAGNPAASAALGKCMGGNSCKGQSACKSFDHACKGQNSCKGHGFTMTSKDDCAKISGATWEAPSKG